MTDSLLISSGKIVGACPIGANLGAWVRVEHTGEASSPLPIGMVPIDTT